MKAHGLKHRIENAMYCNALVYNEPTTDQERIAIHSPLEPQQIEKLRALTEVHGWHIAYDRVQAYGYDFFLILIPNMEEAA